MAPLQTADSHCKELRSVIKSEPLVPYRTSSENFVPVAVKFLGCFQTDKIDEVVQRLNHRGISLVEGGDLFGGDGLLRSKGCRMPAVSGA